MVHKITVSKETSPIVELIDDLLKKNVPVYIYLSSEKIPIPSDLEIRVLNNEYLEVYNPGLNTIECRFKLEHIVGAGRC